MDNSTGETDRRAVLRAGLGTFATVLVAPGALAGDTAYAGSGDMADPASAGFAERAGSAPFRVPAGVHKISADVTVGAFVTFDAGAMLDIATGMTVTFAAGISAPLTHIFLCRGTGAVVFLVQPTEAYPEWWGARPGDPAFDCLPALVACMTAAQRTRLSPAVYHVANTLIWNLDDRALLGSLPGYGSSNVSTVFLTGANAATNPIFRFGASAAAVVRGQYCENVAFSRAGTANGSATGDAEDGVKGVLFTGTTNSEMRRCRVHNSPIGFHVTHIATCNLIDCNVSPAASATRDLCIAYLFGGYTTYPGFVGANGSLRAEGNTAFDFPASTFSAHTLVFGLPADTWLEKPEGSGGKYGIVITGLAKPSMHLFLAGETTGLTVLAEAQSCQDITLDSPRMDSAAVINFYFAHMNDYASINVHNPYSLTTATNFAANHIGRLSLNGGEVIGTSATGGATGTGLDANSVAVLSVDSFFRDCRTPVRITSCTGAKIEPDIYNLVANAVTGVQLCSVTRSSCRPTIRGSRGAFANGVTMDAATTLTSVDGSRIDPNCLAAASPASKVLYDGADARAHSGTNVLSGVIA